MCEGCGKPMTRHDAVDAVDDEHDVEALAVVAKPVTPARDPLIMTALTNLQGRVQKLEDKYATSITVEDVVRHRRALTDEQLDAVFQAAERAATAAVERLALVKAEMQERGLLVGDASQN
jgi:hypothetical protein